MTSASPSDVVSYVPYTENVTLARRRVARVVSAWGHPALAGDAALIAGELAANALLHGCLRDRLFRVEVGLLEKTLRIAVTDPRGERHPQPRHALDDEQFGRGLTIVAALAARWGVEPLTVGKTVWAELNLAPTSTAPGSAGCLTALTSGSVCLRTDTRCAHQRPLPVRSSTPNGNVSFRGAGARGCP